MNSLKRLPVLSPHACSRDDCWLFYKIISFRYRALWNDLICPARWSIHPYGKIGSCKPLALSKGSNAAMDGTEKCLGSHPWKTCSKREQGCTWTCCTLQGVGWGGNIQTSLPSLWSLVLKLVKALVYTRGHHKLKSVPHLQGHINYFLWLMLGTHRPSRPKGNSWIQIIWINNLQSPLNTCLRKNFRAVTLKITAAAWYALNNMEFSRRTLKWRVCGRFP